MKFSKLWETLGTFSVQLFVDTKILIIKFTEKFKKILSIIRKNFPELLKLVCENLMKFLQNY